VFAPQCRRLKEKLASTEAELSTLQNGKLTKCIASFKNKVDYFMKFRKMLV